MDREELCNELLELLDKVYDKAIEPEQIELIHEMQKLLINNK